MRVHLESLIGVAFFYIIILSIGIWASRKKKSNTSAESLFLAGRKMPLLIGAFTMTATWVGGGYINGTAEAVYDRGLVWCQAPWGYALSLFVGGLFFAGAMRARNYTTFLDLFEQNYGKEVSAVLFVPALIGEIFWSAAILTALGAAFSTILGINYQTAIIISAVFAITYTFIGGLWSVAYTDILQLILIFIGLAIAVPFALEHVGSFSELMTKYTAHFKSAASLLPPKDAILGKNVQWGYQAWSWFDTALLLIFGGIPWGVYFQRVLATPDTKTAKGLSYLASFACILLAVPPAIIGAIGTTVDWSATSVGSAPMGPMVLPYVLQYLVPKWVTVLGLGAIAAAVMSSVASSILSGSSMFVWNVYRPLIDPRASDRRILIMIKCAIILVGSLATSLALSVKSVYDLWYFCADLVYVILFPQLVMALFFKASNKYGSIAGILVGAILRLGGGEALLNVPNFIPYPMTDPELGVLFPFRTFAMISSLITIAVVSWLTSKSEESLAIPIEQEN